MSVYTEASAKGAYTKNLVYVKKADSTVKVILETDVFTLFYFWYKPVNFKERNLT